MIRRPPRSTLDRSSAASDVYKRQEQMSAFGVRVGETVEVRCTQQMSFVCEVRCVVDAFFAEMLSQGCCWSLCRNGVGVFGSLSMERGAHVWMLSCEGLLAASCGGEHAQDCELWGACCERAVVRGCEQCVVELSLIHI